MVWISKRLGLAYVGVPKAGSNSVSRWLHGTCGVKQVGYHHSTGPIPDGYDVLLVVRDPKPRALSYHAHKLRRGKPEEGTSLADFLTVLKDGGGVLGRNAAPQAAYANRCRPTLTFDVARTEELEDWLSGRTGRQVGRIAPCHRGENVDRDHAWTAEEEGLLLEYEHETYARWGGALRLDPARARWQDSLMPLPTPPTVGSTWLTPTGYRFEVALVENQMIELDPADDRPAGMIIQEEEWEDIAGWTQLT